MISRETNQHTTQYMPTTKHRHMTLTTSQGESGEHSIGYIYLGFGRHRGQTTSLFLCQCHLPCFVMSTTLATPATPRDVFNHVLVSTSADSFPSTTGTTDYHSGLMCWEQDIPRLKRSFQDFKTHVFQYGQFKISRYQCVKIYTSVSRIC